MPPAMSSDTDIFLSHRVDKSQPNSAALPEEETKDEEEHLPVKHPFESHTNRTDDWSPHPPPMPASTPSSSTASENDDLMKDGLMIALENLLPRKKNFSSAHSRGSSNVSSSPISMSDRSSRTFNASNAEQASSKGSSSLPTIPPVSPRGGARRSKRRDEPTSPSKSRGRLSGSSRREGGTSDARTAGSIATAVTETTPTTAATAASGATPSSLVATIVSTAFNSPLEHNMEDTTMSTPLQKKADHHPRHRSRSEGKGRHRRKKSPRGHGTQLSPSSEEFTTDVPGEDGDDENDQDGFRLIVPTDNYSQEIRSRSQSKHRRRRSPRHLGGGGGGGGDKAIDYTACDDDRFPVGPPLSPVIIAQPRDRSKSPRGSSHGHIVIPFASVASVDLSSTDGWMRQMSEDRFAGSPTNPFKKVVPVDSNLPKSPISMKDSRPVNPASTSAPRKGRRQRKSESQASESVDPFVTPFSPSSTQKGNQRNSMASLVDLLELMKNSELPVPLFLSDTNHDPSLDHSNLSRRSNITATSNSARRARSRSQEGQKWPSPIAQPAYVGNNLRLSSSSVATATTASASPSSSRGDSRSKSSHWTRKSGSKSPVPLPKATLLVERDEVPRAPPSPRLRDSSNHSNGPLSYSQSNSTDMSKGSESVQVKRSSSISRRQHRNRRSGSLVPEPRGTDRTNNADGVGQDFDPTQAGPDQKGQAWLRRRLRIQGGGTDGNNNGSVEDVPDIRGDTAQERRHAAVAEQRRRSLGKGNAGGASNGGATGVPTRRLSQNIERPGPTRRLSRSVDRSAPTPSRRLSQCAERPPPTRRHSRSVERPAQAPTRRLSRSVERPAQTPTRRFRRSVERPAPAPTRRLSRSVDRSAPTPTRRLSRHTERPTMKRHVKAPPL